MRNFFVLVVLSVLFLGGCFPGLQKAKSTSNAADSVEQIRAKASLGDASAQFNIGVTEQMIERVRARLRSQAEAFLVQTEEDKERAKHVGADEILREGKPAGKVGFSPRQPVDKDW